MKGDAHEKEARKKEAKKGLLKHKGISHEELLKKIQRAKKKIAERESSNKKLRGVRSEVPEDHY